MGGSISTHAVIREYHDWAGDREMEIFDTGIKFGVRPPWGLEQWVKEPEWNNKSTEASIIAGRRPNKCPKWISYFMCATNVERGLRGRETFSKQCSVVDEGFVALRCRPAGVISSRLMPHWLKTL
jgi:hypothetical protein